MSNLTWGSSVAPDARLDSDFIAGGFARVDYVNSPTWKRAWAQLEPISRQFGSLVWSSGRHGYVWPLDPLRWWSRTWEYPFIAAQLSRLQTQLSGARTLDIGAAVTFFSFFLLQQGFDLTNLDYDSSMPAHFSRALGATGGKLFAGAAPKYVVADARDTRLPEGSFDLVTCVSVLEHIPQWERTIPEIRRLVAPGGHFILTFDVRRDEQSNGLSITDVAKLLDLVNEGFEPLTRIEKQIPPDALHNENTPMPTVTPPGKWDAGSYVSRLGPPTAWPGKAARLLARAFRPPPPPAPENLVIYGGVWRKR